MAHGGCSKSGCDCQTFAFSLMAPGLCKRCNHLKDLHNVMINDQNQNQNHNAGILANKAIIGTPIAIDSSDEEYDLQTHSQNDDYKHNTKSNDDNFNQLTFQSAVTNLNKKHKKKDKKQEIEFWKAKYEKSNENLQNLRSKYNELQQKYDKLKSNMDQMSQSKSNEQSNKNDNTDTNIDPESVFANWTSFN